MEQLDRVVSLAEEVLGDDAIGAYLHGSSVLGGLKPHSDLDVVVVSRRPTMPEERRRCIEGLLPISGRGDPTGRSRSLEVSIVVQSDVRPWHYPPRLDFMYGDWWRKEFQAGNLSPWESPNPDLAIVLTQVLRGNRPLFGPPPGDLLDPIPIGDVRRAMLDGIPGLLADLEGDTANVVLTFARIWVTMATGEIQPKDVAADWALKRLPEAHRRILARARGVYLGTEVDRWADLSDRVRPHADHVLAEVHRLEGPPRA